MVDEQRKPKPGIDKAVQSRDAARAEALRANLQKRKAQARSRASLDEAQSRPRQGDA